MFSSLTAHRQHNARRQHNVRSIVSVEDILLKTKNIFETNVTEGFQDLTENVATWESLTLGTYNEPGIHNHWIDLLAKLNENPLIKHRPTDEVHEGWVAFFEDMFNRPFAAPAKQAEIIHVELREAIEEIQEEQDISNEFFIPAELNDVLADLREVTDEAREEGFPVPSDIAMANSEQLIKIFTGFHPVAMGCILHKMAKLPLMFSMGKEAQSFCCVIQPGELYVWLT